jgi:adenosine 3'-phospho 5'-phosphosulfate transporter B3
MRATPTPTLSLVHRGAPAVHFIDTDLSQPTDEELYMTFDEEAGLELSEAPRFDSLKLGGVIELGHLSSGLQFAILALGMFVLYIGHAYFQERIFSTPGFKSYFFVSFCDFLLFAVLSGTQLLLLEGGRIPRNSPLQNFLGISLSLAVSIGCGFASLAYLNYPTKVLFKSGKIIPTMLLGKLFGRSYGLFEYVAAVLLCGGLAAFTLGQASVSPSFHLVGVALISVAAMSEAAVGNLQEHILSRHKCKLLEIVFWSNFFSATVVLVYLVVSGELISSLEQVWQSAELMQTICFEAVIGYVAVFFYLGLVQRFGVAVCIGVSALRKIATICLSFLVFPKPFTIMYVYGGGMVMAAILMTAYLKNSGKSGSHISPSRRVKTHAI